MIKLVVSFAREVAFFFICVSFPASYLLFKRVRKGNKNVVKVRVFLKRIQEKEF